MCEEKKCDREECLDCPIECPDCWGEGRVMGWDDQWCSRTDSHYTREFVAECDRCLGTGEIYE